MFLVTYKDSRSTSGIGHSIVSSLPDFIMKGYEVISATPYSRETDTVFTPAVVTACVGTSASR